MMGRLEAQENLFYRFRIEDHVPKDHLLRRIDWLLDFDVIRYELTAFYSHTGRPSIDPELMLRMISTSLIAGFANLGWTGGCQIVRRSPRTGMGVLLMVM
jgi:hypothetical protein